MIAILFIKMYNYIDKVIRGAVLPNEVQKW
jgi:hypothetical protein